jgi:hypothetical protein
MGISYEMPTPQKILTADKIRREYRAIHNRTAA